LQSQLQYHYVMHGPDLSILEKNSRGKLPCIKSWSRISTALCVP